MRLITLACLMLVLASSAAAQTPQGETHTPDITPIVQVGVFGLKADGNFGSAALETARSAGEEFSAGVSTNGCRFNAGSGVHSPRSARLNRDGWELSGRVVSVNAQEAVVDLSWRRVRQEGQDVDQQHRTRLTLPLDRPVTLDTARPDPVECPSSYGAAFAARYSSLYSSTTRIVPNSDRSAFVGSGAAVGPSYGADLWLVHSVPGQPETALPTHVRLGRDGAAFDFPPMTVAVPGGSLVVHVKGQLRIAGGGQLMFTAEREAMFVPSGRPARDPGVREAEGRAAVTRQLPRPNEVLEFEMPELNVRGLPKIADIFSVRLRIGPSK